jgi:DNA-binding PadR family transcriptional regulator
MALEHAILVSLSERRASGLDLTRRFDRSIGFFWSATHQQIYRVLGRMEAGGWVVAEHVAQQGKADKKVYDVAPAGRAELERWLAEPTPGEAFRSEVAVKLRAASYGDRAAVLAQVEAHRADHATRLEHYERLADRDFPDGADGLSPQQLDVYLVLRGGIRLEQFWVDWLTEYLDAHAPSPTGARR